VEVRDVFFRHPGADKAALGGLPFGVGPGEPAIITGPSGAGKSTVSKMLLRFYDPDSGSVLLDSTRLGDLHGRGPGPSRPRTATAHPAPPPANSLTAASCSATRHPGTGPDPPHGFPRTGA
jgi:energy-coupling factor transporter ATP-binding protein EcfA2